MDRWGVGTTIAVVAAAAAATAKFVGVVAAVVAGAAATADVAASVPTPARPIAFISRGGVGYINLGNGRPVPWTTVISPLPRHRCS